MTAVVAKNVKQHGNVLVPKGATAFGRIVILQRIPGQVPLFRCGVRFYSLEFEGKRAAFIGRLEDAGGLAVLRGFHFPTIDTPDLEQRPGLGVLELRAYRFQLPRGYHMRWRTDTTPTVENP